jgi:hypothetical protein
VIEIVREPPLVRQIISLGEDLPKLWDAASVVERKQILRLVVKEVRRLADNLNHYEII